MERGLCLSLYPCMKDRCIVSGWVCLRALLLAFPSIFKDLPPPFHLVGFHRNHLVWLLSRKKNSCLRHEFVMSYSKVMLPSHNLFFIYETNVSGGKHMTCKILQYSPVSFTRPVWRGGGGVALMTRDTPA